MVDALTRTHIRRMRVADIRCELEERGIDTTGKKPELITKLIAANEDNFMQRGVTHDRKSQGVGFDEVASKCTFDVTNATAIGDPKPPVSAASMRYLMQFDGGSRGNPGPGGAGAVLYRCEE
ncbi:unnamed protein product [Choristocarpus tenellus]